MSLFDTGIRPQIDDWLLTKSKEERDYGNYWSASSAGYCMRRLIFERLGVPKVENESDARKQRVFTSGHLFHEWIQGITKESGLSIAQEVELQDEDLMVRGHIDDLVLVGGEITVSASDVPMTPDNPSQLRKMEIDKRLILYDYKTVNSRSFTYAKQNGNEMSHYHKMQLGTYMYMLRKGDLENVSDETAENMGAPGSLSAAIQLRDDFKDLSEARILKISKDDLRMDEQQLLWSEALEKEVYSYWSTLNGYWKNKKLPKCTCDKYENGFLAREGYNPFFYEDEPCSLKWYEKWRKETK